VRRGTRPTRLQSFRNRTHRLYLDDAGSASKKDDPILGGRNMSVARVVAPKHHGEWPAQDCTGLFFRTALLNYTLYFPLWVDVIQDPVEQRLHRDGVDRHGADG